MTDPKMAIVMIRRDESGRLHLVDGRGNDRTISTDAELRQAVDAVLDDPDIPQAEQVAHLEYAAEQVFAQAAASLLPEVARPLAAPIVRDLGQLLRKAALEFPKRVPKTPAPEATHQRRARARSARLRNFRQRTGTGTRRGAA